MFRKVQKIGNISKVDVQHMYKKEGTFGFRTNYAIKTVEETISRVENGGRTFELLSKAM